MRNLILFFVFILLFNFYCSEIYSQIYRIDSTFGVDGYYKFNEAAGSNQYDFDIDEAGNILYSFTRPLALVLGALTPNGKLNSSLLSCSLKTDMNPLFSFIEYDQGGRLITGVMDFSNSKNTFFKAISLNCKSDTNYANGQNVNLNEIINKIELSPEGKLIVADRFSVDGKQVFIKAFTKEGFADTSFGTNGLCKINFDKEIDPRIDEIIIAKDKNIFLAINGPGSNNFCACAVIVKINPNGIIDSSFGKNGKVFITDTSSNIVHINGLIVSDNGKILYSFLGTPDPRWFIGRLNGDGSLDIAFGQNGVTPLGAHTNYSADGFLFEQNNGKIIFIASRPADNIFLSNIVRLESNGKIDSSYNIPDTTFYNIVINKILPVDNHNNILLLGWARDSNNKSKTVISKLVIKGIVRDVDLENDIINAIIFPNPILNSEAILNIEVSKTQKVNVMLYDPRGQLITTLYRNKSIAKGSDNMQLDFNKIPSGMYFLKIQAGSSIRNIKCLLFN